MRTKPSGGILCSPMHMCVASPCQVQIFAGDPLLSPGIGRCRTVSALTNLSIMPISSGSAIEKGPQVLKAQRCWVMQRSCCADWHQAVFDVNGSMHIIQCSVSIFGNAPSRLSSGMSIARSKGLGQVRRPGPCRSCALAATLHAESCWSCALRRLLQY